METITIDTTIKYAIYFTLAFLIAYFLGRKKNIGGGYSFFLSILLSPIIGLIITAASSRYDADRLRESKSRKIIGILLSIFGVFIFLLSFGNYHVMAQYHDTSTSEGLEMIMSVSCGLFTLGLYQYNRGLGKTYVGNNFKENSPKKDGKLFILTESNTTHENKTAPNVSFNFTKIILVSLTGCGIAIVLFFLNANDKNNYNSNNEKAEITLKVPKYKKVEEYIYELNTGQTKIFSVKDHPKAHGANWQMRIPNSFTIITGDKSNVISKIGTKDFNPYITIGIGAHKLSISENRILSNEEIKDFFNDPTVIAEIVTDKGSFISGEKIIIDGDNPAYMAEIEFNFKNIDKEIKMRSLIFMFIDNKVIFTVSCNISTLDLEENLKDKMDQHREFYKIIANSIVINSSETEGKSSLSDNSLSIGKVNRDKVNLRIEPELESHIVALINKGELFYIIHKSEEKMTVTNLGTYYWYFVENDNYKGWIFGKFLDLE